MPLRPEPNYRDMRTYRRSKPRSSALLPWFLLLAIIAVALLAHYVTAADRPEQRPELRWGTPTAPENFEPGFVSGHAGHFVVWTIEHLTKDKLDGPVKRKGFKFFSPTEVPEEWRPTLADYRGSGFDRGHISPASDNTSSVEAMKRCFSLKNMMPQTAELNRGPWRLLEEHIRDIVRNEADEAWVVTLELFVPDPDTGVITIQTIGDGREWVPNECAKAVLTVREGKIDKMLAWSLPNDHDPPDFEECETSVDALEALAALNLFDGVPDDLEAALEANGA